MLILMNNEHKHCIMLGIDGVDIRILEVGLM